MLGIHSLLEELTGVEELGIDEGEATRVAKALDKYSKHHKMAAIALSPKTRAKFDLVTALGSVYGTRLISLYRKSKKGTATVMRPVEVPRPAPKQPTTIDAQPQPKPQAGPVDAEILEALARHRAVGDSGEGSL